MTMATPALSPMSRSSRLLHPQIANGTGFGPFAFDGGRPIVQPSVRPDVLASCRRQTIDIFLETIALTISALLPITNPFSTAPLFASLAATYDKEKQRQQALLACGYALGILVTFLLLGAVIV